MSDKESSNNTSKGPSGWPPSTPMPAQGVSPSSGPPRPTDPSLKVSAMNDYPNGRGGMRMVPVMAPEQATQSQPAVRPFSPIGARPPAMKMPTAK
jgi:hypothetical protein